MTISAMTTGLSLRSASIALDDGLEADPSAIKRGNVLSTKLTNVLSSSYADSEIRDALRIFEKRYGHSDLDRDFDLRYQTQKEIVETNAKIVDDFSQVAKV